MRKALVFMTVLVLGLCVVSQAAIIGDPASWDVMDEDYGTDTGQINFSANWSTPSGSGYPNFDPATAETMTADSAIITSLASESFVRQSISETLTNHTFEVRMAVSAATNLEIRALGGYSWDFRYQNNGADFKNWDGSSIEPLPVDFDKTAMNIYRIVVDDASGSVSVSLYLNNDPTPIAGMSQLPNPNEVKALDIFFSGGASFEIDYAHIATGVYTPIPEPTMLGMLGIGGLFAMFRKKQ